MPRILPFPFSDRAVDNKPIPEEPIAEGPITDDRIALTNAILRTLRAWITEHEGVTAEDLKWALLVAGDCIAADHDDADGETGGA